MARKKQQDPNDFSQFRPPQLNLRKDTRRAVMVVVFVVLSLLFLLSLVGFAGPFGEISEKILKLAFGWVAYIAPLIFLFVAIALFRQDPEEEYKSVSTHAYVGAVLLTITLTGFLHLMVIRNDVSQAFELVKAGQGGGYLGVLTSYLLMHLMGFWASLIVVL